MTNRRRGKHPCAARNIRIERCGPTGKLSYRTARAAQAAIELARESAAENSRRREQRWYPCKYGPHFHLTSEDALPRLAAEVRRS